MFLSDPPCSFDPMLIDCETCLVRESDACNDCLVTVLFSDQPLEVDETEENALANLAAAGLVPRLRLVLPDRRAG